MHLSLGQKLTIKSCYDHYYTISGYASVYNVIDQQNDIIVKGAFAENSNNVNNAIKFLWQHDFQKPLGVIKSICEDEYGLKINADINSKIEVGREAIELIKQGAVNGLSIGFNIKSADYNEYGQRIITEGELIEVSIVTFPANKQAQIKLEKFLKPVTPDSNPDSNPEYSAHVAKNYNTIVSLKEDLNALNKIIIKYELTKKI